MGRPEHRVRGSARTHPTGEPYERADRPGGPTVPEDYEPRRPRVLPRCGSRPRAARCCLAFACQRALEGFVYPAPAFESDEAALVSASTRGIDHEPYYLEQFMPQARRAESYRSPVSAVHD